MGIGLSSHTTRDRTRGHRLKLCQGGEVGHQEEFLHRKDSSTLKALPREVVEPPSLKVFKDQLDMTLGALLWLTRWCLGQSLTQ